MKDFGSVKTLPYNSVTVEGRKMIEFRGYLTGTAEKYLFQKSKVFALKIILVAAAILFPVFLIIAIDTGVWIFFIIYCVGILTSLVGLCIPQRKKVRRALTPNRIYTDGEYITCVAEKYKEIRFVKDVKVVLDFGEFYELVFYYGKGSQNYICQKDLLRTGSIVKFEKLFKSKIVRNPRK